MNHMNKMLLSLLAAVTLMLPGASHAAVDGDDGGPAPRRHAGPPGHQGLHEGQDLDGPRGLRGMPGTGALPFLRGPDLSEAQQDRIFALVHGQAPYLREQHKAHEKAERALFELHGAAKYDDAAAVKLAQAAAQAMANITLQHLRTEQKVLAVLTAEQRKQVEEAKLRPDRLARP
ncbi:Spy/CpxP family protein refolding chaperone [Pseudoduganella chitinolytica]|uniref:Spy/CpxP family protein refolding chaperone n=1 Tax=Pseudoduganella chitinolytica TaxID=34070 RepID=A0ABY8BFM4_9BURK|nr:Spy/CpxP family protein refolding chaperone [Pseudoduganella chitinolytica]WEF34707.1 Spy/CpxP family protein refolding chaperone [Pseudoduganella chitinolytica]